MSWEIGVSTGSFYPFQRTDYAIRSIAKAGFSVAELFLQTPSEYTPLFGRRVMREMLAAGVRMHSVHLNMKDLDPFSPYPPRRADADMLFRRSLELANTVKARVVNWHGARQSEIKGGLLPELLWETAERWRSWAEEAGVMLALENVSWCSMRTPDDVRSTRTTLPKLHFTFDCFQAAEAGALPTEVVRAMADRIATVHLSDYEPGGARHLLPGRGTIDWGSLLCTLAELHYTGPLLIELSHLTAENYGAALAESQRFLANIIEAQGLHLRIT